MNTAVVKWSDIGAAKRMDARFFIELTRHRPTVDRLLKGKTREQLIEFASQTVEACPEAWDAVRRTMTLCPVRNTGGQLTDALERKAVTKVFQWQNYTTTDIALYCAMAAFVHRQSIEDKRTALTESLRQLAVKDEAFRIFTEGT